MVNSHWWQALLVGTLACVLGACGSDGRNGVDGASGRNGANGSNGADGLAALIAVHPEPPGSNCASGGSRIDAGQDANGDGALEPNEIGGTQYVCNGSSGSGTAVSSLVANSDEPAGSNCAEGGKRFSAGQDRNGNGVLEDSEVASTGYACHGNDGASGAAGTNALVAVVSEPAGTNCGSGGVRVTSGPDTNSNGTLETAEVTSTQYVCSGATGSTGGNGNDGRSALISTASEPDGVNCQYGGTRIHAGLDVDGNGTLGAGEITATAYACNGAPGPGITWTEVTGNAVQTVVATGYLVNNDIQQAVLTLPTTPPIGSVIQVSGIGRGGWKLAQNAGQYVVTSSLPGGGIRERYREGPSGAGWTAVACSSDGTVMLATAFGGQIYESLDGGATWHAEESNRAWSGLAVSANGASMFAIAGTQIYEGYDTTSIWDTRGPAANWSAVAMSADGVKIVATASGGFVYTSEDSGRNWTSRDEIRSWISVASSGDGTKLVAAVDGGRLYTSTDSGANWTARDSARNWRAVASSADGTKLVATDMGDAGAGNGHIYTSTDSGQTWTAREQGEWFRVASSADGTRLTASTDISLYTSVDSGATWTRHRSVGRFASVALSADATRLVVGALGPRIFVVSPVPAAVTTTGTAGSIIGGQHDAIALQYTGNGKFVVLSYSGTFVVQ